MKKELIVGEKASLKKTFSAKDVEQFAAISQDANPLHLDDEAARAAGFEGRIVHGMLAASLFSALLGMELPGEGTIYLGQELRFNKPIYIDDELTAKVEIMQIREDKPIVTLRTTCENGNGDLLIEGEAVVKTP